MIVNGDHEWDFWLFNSRFGTWGEVLVRCSCLEMSAGLDDGFKANGLLFKHVEFV